MEIGDLLYYCDTFDPPECNFDLRDSLNNDWLENIFNAPLSACSSSTSLISSPSSSASPVTDAVLDDLLLSGSSSPDSVVQHEHSYSMHECNYDIFPLPLSLDSWPSVSENERGYSFDFLKDIDHNYDPDSEIFNEKEQETTGMKVKDDVNLELKRWLEKSYTAPVEAVVSRSPPTRIRKNVILFTDEEGQTMKFTSEEPNMHNDELVLVDWIQEEHNMNPIDLSVYKVPSKGKAHISEQISTMTSVRQSHCNSWRKEVDKANPPSFTLAEALFSNPAPTEGVILLTDEEKNTLATEGYPIPTKLPLGKAEEKYLKKIRRKIKNKISAQESRRKKREYMDLLEVKMHQYCHQNMELTKKVEQLENNNRLLLSQLQNVQKSVKLPGMATPSGTSLMVLVLFFAAFIGSWSPTISWSIGYRWIPSIQIASDNQLVSTATASGGAIPKPCGPLVGPALQHPLVQTYSNFKMRSRLLMSTKDDVYNESTNLSTFGPTIPVSYREAITTWFHSFTGKTLHKENREKERKEAGNSGRGFVRDILPLSHYSTTIKSSQDASNESYSLLGPVSQPSLPIPITNESYLGIETVDA